MHGLRRFLRRLGATLAGAALAGWALALTAPATAAAAALPSGGNLLIAPNPYGPWQANFNPFNPNNMFAQALDPVYEPLWYFDLANNRSYPWLATAYRWQNPTTLVFALRHGVTWSDGKPFTSADVVFTLNMLHRYPALDTNGLWTFLQSVHASGPYGVTVTLQKPNRPVLWYLAGQTPIVPQHLWVSVKNPVLWTDPHPVGTGPYLLSSQSAESIVYVRNPHYWNGMPAVGRISVPAFSDFNAENGQEIQGKFDWAQAFIPNIERLYVAPSRGTHFSWSPPVSLVGLYPNLTAYPLSDPAFRQAIAYAVDRAAVSRLGEDGQEPPVPNMTGVILPFEQSYEDQSLAAQYAYAYSPARARATLRRAGYHAGPGGTLTGPHGSVHLTLQVIGAYPDWVQDAAIVAQDLRAVGIPVTVQDVSVGSYQQNVEQGHFQLAMGGTNNMGPSPWYIFNSVLNSAFTAPVGQTAISNYERFRSAQADALLKDYATTSSSAKQKSDLYGLERIMATQLPIIPLVYGADWAQYQTTQVVGWPTPQDAYALPSMYNWPDDIVILMHLHPR